MQQDTFRESYRTVTDDEKLLIQELKEQANGMEALLSGVHNPRYKALALTALEQSVMWAVKGITSSQE